MERIGMQAALIMLPMALSLAGQTGPAPASGWPLRPAGRQVTLGRLPMSAAVSPDGKYLVALNGGAGAASISVLDTATERVVANQPVADAWLGLAFSPRGDRVYVGGGSQAAVLEFAFVDGRLRPIRTFRVTPPEKRGPRNFVGDVAFDPAGRLLYAADLFHDSIAVINPQSGTVMERFPTGRRPYRILFPPDGKTFLVSSWADGTVYLHDAGNGAVIGKLPLGAHPTDMLWLPGRPEAEAEGQLEWVKARLFVAAANTNNVYVLGATEGGELRQIDTINVSLTPWQPAGSTPSALAVSPDGKRLLVVCSGVNAVAVEEIGGARAETVGFIPTGGYPTAIRVLRDGRVVVLNGGAQGTASIIDPPGEDDWEAYSRTVLENMPYRDALLEDAASGPDSPIPSAPNQASPIRHVLYIAGEGGSDGANHRKLGREFVRLDHFQADGEPGAESGQWATAAIASDFTAKMAPRPFDYEGEPAAQPASGYLWTNAAAAGLSLRNYGYFVANRPLKEATGAIQVQVVKDPVLNRATNLRYRGPDPDYPDAERARVFLEDLAEFEKTGEMPALMLMRLTDDSALGQVVEAVSRSRFWKDTAIFVLPGLVISPYVKRGGVDGTMYNTTSMLRTMELILGLRPMTVFDGGARPMFNCFQKTVDFRPYTAERAHR